MLYIIELVYLIQSANQTYIIELVYLIQSANQTC